ncbi:MAG: serine hydrolase domain-containing protein [Inquilinaceae bacterium]
MAKATTGAAWSRDGLTALDTAMAGHVARGGIPGVVALLARGDDVHVTVHGAMDFGETAPMRRDTIFRIASLTKPVSAAIAMMLVEDGKFTLDEPVDRLLPELAGRRVLKHLDGPVDDTVPALRPILIGDLLTLRMGMGAIFSADPHPIVQAMADRGIAVGPHLPEADGPDDYIAKLGALPLMHQPGEMWMYDTGMHVLGVLIERAADRPLADLFEERLFTPLGMIDTGFSVPADKLDRLPACHWRNHGTGAVEVFDPAGPDSRFARTPGFANAAGGLVSTADDYLAFARMMLNGGDHAGRRLLSRDSVSLMTRDHITADQKARSVFAPGFWDQYGWGLGMAVSHRKTKGEPYGLGWDGGYGTSGYWDPESGLIGILLTQRLWDSPEPPAVRKEFWQAANAALGQ